MISKNSITGSGFCSISEAPKILLLKFWFFYFQFLFLEIFLIPLIFNCFSFEFFFSFTSLSSHNFWFSVLQWAGGVVLCLEIFQVAKFWQPAEFRRLRNFATCENSQVALFISCPFHLSSAANPSFLAPTINFPFLFRSNH